MGSGGSEAGAGAGEAGAGASEAGAAGSGGDACEGAPGPSCPCVRVAPSGDDALATTSAGVTPFLTVQSAIDFAASLSESPRNVCIANGAACGATAEFPAAAGVAIRMRDGVSVYGRYESTTWRRCTSGETILEPAATEGVSFDDSVTAGTLDGVTVARLGSVTTGVSIAAAQNVIVHDVSIVDGNPTGQLVGVAVSDGASATLGITERAETRSGDPLVVAQETGILVTNSTVIVSSADLTLRADHAGTAIGIELDSSTATVTGNHITVLGAFDDATLLVGIQVTGSGSFDRNVIAAGQATFAGATAIGIHALNGAGSVTSLGNETIDVVAHESALGAFGDSAAITLGGAVTATCDMDAEAVAILFASGSDIAGTLTAHGSTASGVNGSGADGTVVHDATIVTETAAAAQGPEGVGFEASDGVVVRDNPSITAIAGSENSFVYGIIINDSTGVTIERNGVIAAIGGSISGAEELWGIKCSSSNNSGQSCAITDNPDIHVTSGGAAAGATVTAYGIECYGCSEISDNTISGPTTTGDHRSAKYRGDGVLANSSDLVRRNRITAGCSGDGSGLEIDTGRVENNVIRGPSCGAALPDGLSKSRALKVTIEGEIVNNTLEGGGAHDFVPADGDVYAGCWSAALDLSSQLRVFDIRNNIFVAGTCTPSYGVAETDASVRPDFLWHNDFDPTAVTGALYLDDDARPLSTVAELFGLADSNVSGNISAPADLTPDAHLTANSACIDAGTLTNAAGTDLDGVERDNHPDIGADEWTGAPSACHNVQCYNGVCQQGACACDPGYSDANCF
jgi:hypothetical protein